MRDIRVRIVQEESEPMTAQTIYTAHAWDEQGNFAEAKAFSETEAFHHAIERVKRQRR